MAYQNYRDLEVYQLAHTLAIEIHKMSLGLPNLEKFEQAAQIRKSAKSIAVNIVEGFGRRRYKNEFIQFLVYSLASCDETREHLDILLETDSIENKQEYEYFKESYEKLGRKLTNFIKTVEEKHLTPKKN